MSYNAATNGTGTPEMMAQMSGRGGKRHGKRHSKRASRK